MHVSAILGTRAMAICVTYTPHGPTAAVVHDPFILPLAAVHKATKNFHGTAFEHDDLVAYHYQRHPVEPAGHRYQVRTTYFALNINEGNQEEQSILRGRIEVMDHKIPESELFINRYRGNHGLSFNSSQLPSNYATLTPTANRTRSSRAELQALSGALLSTVNDLKGHCC
ncbi:hypothetical protein BDW69DRAFT_190503 [Aspergillus filifer]